ncbi:MAG TPA: response regulator transcription factor [Noviherbaspirillum sp.]|uniref:response regulator transcription factor n=1 Tax=Noviherbaspirillum sp. TaxID=1926288 RepID=UPI002D37DF63|nr:response regulator transcription factor [Noviherbaspirillum sp.]HYD97276.1 response regulator transcription factor [Noviherbaspirillum sp.]
MTTKDTDPPRVLIVEDEPDLRDAMVAWLNRKNVVADGVGDCASFAAWSRTHECDVVVLDLGLPDGDGLEIASAVRTAGSSALVLATARGHIDDRLKGYESGADAYLVKPVDLRELLMVVLNLTKHVRSREVLPPWRFDELSWMLVAPNGRKTRLTRTECGVLRRLAEQPGKVVSRTVLARAIGYDPDIYDRRTMDTLIRRLRRKCEEVLGIPLPLETVHAMGLAFTARIRVEKGTVTPDPG